MAAGGIRNVPFFHAISVFLAISLALNHNCIEAKVTHHVVGQDRGWDPSSDVSSWAARRTFFVGDYLWFTYSSALDSVLELGSRDEYEDCDLSNPIRVHNDGLSKVSLDGEGIRYFASGNPESCKKGLKLPILTKPRLGEQAAVMIKPLAHSETAALAEAPLAPQPMPSGGVWLTTNWAAVGFQALLAALFFLSIGL